MAAVCLEKYSSRSSNRSISYLDGDTLSKFGLQVDFDLLK